MANRIEYREGGNPPLAAGLFSVPDQQGRHRRRIESIVRLAWWPAHIAPTDSNLNRVVVDLVWKRENDKPITREQIADLFLWSGRGYRES